jgi:hypothetical protein
MERTDLDRGPGMKGNAKALAFGILVGVALVIAWVAAQWKMDDLAVGGAEMLLDLRSRITFAGPYALFVAIPLAIPCAPLWLVLERYRLTSAFTAAGLGFTAVLAYWILDNSGVPAWPMLTSGLPFALCGAAAGLATWWARPRPSAP